ncbi:twin transmembrane helix small protein [Methylomarinum sp. Ch1-1]|uniref:Twin transmembrane helix small protein n=1 Tax=Methylomarinum roseum TaxID=3067653 RepID=A0AAU7NQ57_9GAMM|nr:twin transmembrane helix small protein [Methylomarinum sp. Ch1-1]MDP4521334.1 twin transmembrane helix small protein [Methylomarinum sp. Ch1-1]
MLIKSFIIIAFILIVISLGSALFHLVRRQGEESSEKTAKALTYRIALSLILFILIFLAYATGLIKPQGIGARMQQAQQQAAEKPAGE